MRARPTLLLCILALASGCAPGAGYTIVEKRVTPSRFKFVTIVDPKDRGPGGWQAACLNLRLAHDDGRAYLCKVSVEMPMETKKTGPISARRAQHLATKCANEAADLAFSTTTPATPLGMACTSFINTYALTLRRDLAGSRVSSKCRPEAEAAAIP